MARRNQCCCVTDPASTGKAPTQDEGPERDRLHRLPNSGLESEVHKGCEVRKVRPRASGTLLSDPLLITSRLNRPVSCAMHGPRALAPSSPVLHTILRSDRDLSLAMWSPKHLAPSAPISESARANISSDARLSNQDPRALAPSSPMASLK